ncbi:hypothetical protein [Dyadobacter sp. CY356]|uniref:hypothetical protein n=1 Tax=Dyadobacter sp. CY356 TaxID=2906442 RepID=UPI001F3C6455|nr:hypothetical protein [Dyadobacter sp. CY356]MCF0055543.1 hypothetical protein [Dyadobacter sp. CY356]
MSKVDDYGRIKNKPHLIEKAKKKKNPRFYNKNYREDLHLFESDEDQINALKVETGINFNCD